MLSFLGFVVPALSANPWKGIVRDKVAHPAADATISLQSATGTDNYSATTAASGEFLFRDVAPQKYLVSITANGQTWKVPDPLVIKVGDSLIADLELSDQNQTAALVAGTVVVPQASSSNSHLTSGEVSSLPLNERDLARHLSRSRVSSIRYGLD